LRIEAMAAAASILEKSANIELLAGPAGLRRRSIATEFLRLRRLALSLKYAGQQKTMAEHKERAGKRRTSRRRPREERRP